MLPHGLELPAALLILIGGVVSCFAGYRLFRAVLGLYGFIIGAMMASSLMAASNQTGMLVSAVVGGLIGAAVLMFAYFLGIVLAGAALGAFLSQIVWTAMGKGEPPALAVIGMAVAGALAAQVLQRYVIVVSTAFGGAWMMLVAGLALVDSRRAANAATSADVWIVYPSMPAGAGQRWLPYAWVVLGLIGAATQLRGKAKRRKKT